MRSGWCATRRCRRPSTRWWPEVRALPVWSRVLGAAIGLLLINLLWNDPLRAATGGGAVAFFALNLLPSAAMVAWASLGGGSER